MEGADNTAFEDAPEVFNRVRVNRADDVLALGMVKNCVRKVFPEVLVTNPFVDP
jgi:hypothetical protein